MDIPIFFILRYEQAKAIYRVAGVWRMFCHWAKAGHCHITHTNVVYLHFIFNHGFAADYLYDHGFLAEYQKIYTFGQA